MPKYTFRVMTETYYDRHLIKRGAIIETSKELSKQYPAIFELIGEQNDKKPVEEKEDHKDEKPTEPEADNEKLSEPEEETDVPAEDSAKEDATEDKKPTNAGVDNMTRKELLELAEALHIEGANKMNANQLKKACKTVLESK